MFAFTCFYCPKKLISLKENVKHITLTNVTKTTHYVTSSWILIVLPDYSVIGLKHMKVNNKTAKPSSNHHESDVLDNELRQLNETIQVVRKEKQIRHSIQSQESDIKGILTDFMKSVSEQILELKYELKEHVKKTSAQMEELKDITCGLKKHHSLCCNDISSKMKDVAEESESVKTQMSVLNEELLKRWQSFTDSIKTQLSAITDHKKENHHSVLSQATNQLPSNINRETSLRADLSASTFPSPSSIEPR
ncbi:hypothetical protein DPMN_044386 [Dreissena polymorpha]|uniref:Uncharacterized protein n=1 Tax=Dreissena polymorpha TaxID=45954 RepID=A0A9D4D267_DREPO|nr:hypothetical protein DPMN_044386 [Dreissena polymorpha]